MIKKPDERLQELTELFRERNGIYGSTYKNHGVVLLSVFRGRIPEITTEVDAARFGVLNMIISKICRYTVSWELGHPDSLSDLSVYAQMLSELDDIKRNGHDDIG